MKSEKQSDDLIKTNEQTSPLDFLPSITTFVWITTEKFGFLNMKKNNFQCQYITSPTNAYSNSQKNAPGDIIKSHYKYMN